MATPGLVDLCASLLPPECGGPPPAELAVKVERFLRLLPASTRRAFGAGVAATSALGSARARRRLSAIPPEKRADVLARMARRPAGAQMLDGLKTLVLLVAGAEAGAVELAAWSGAMPLARPDPPELDVTPSHAWPSTNHANVVIIGSGAGGAAVARTLARAGLDTVVVEEGRRHAVEEFRTGHPLDRFASLYRDGGSTFALGRPPIFLPIGRAVGGTTVVNSGTCYRTPASVLERWRDRDGLSLADPQAFDPWLDEAWRTLGAEPVPAAVMGRNGELALQGAAKLGWTSGPLMHNAMRCGGCCQSAIGCVQNAKGAVHLNALPDACASGARIVSEATVARMLHEGGRATGVLARRPDGSEVRVLAPRVVVAAGATETPPLLRRSGLGGHPWVGRHLSIHPALAVLARFEEPVTSWRGVLQSAGVEEFHEREGILLEATSAPFGMGWTAFPGIGPDLLRELDRAEYYGSLGAMIADRSVGRVLGKRRPIVRYALDGGDARRLIRSHELIGQVLFAAGAAEIVVSGDGTSKVTRIEDLREALGRIDPRRLHLAAFHPVGTARAGADPERHPVDADGRLRGIEGVWIADASILPSCPAVNPQVTIMALALAVADGLAGAG